MIEGLQQLPWFQDAARKNLHTVEHLTDCKRCMQDRTASQRQYMACGFEPPITEAQAWRHHARTAPDAKTCIGYLRQLPIVIECARARVHWSKGSLEAFAPCPTENLLIGIEIMEGADADVMRYRSSPEGGS